MSLLFTGKFKVEEWELEHRKGKAESLKWSVIQVTQGFLKGELQGEDSLVFYFIEGQQLCLTTSNMCI